MSPCQENLISLQQPLSLARTGFLRSAEKEGRTKQKKSGVRLLGIFSQYRCKAFSLAELQHQVLLCKTKVMHLMGVPRARGSEPGPWGLGAHIVHCMTVWLSFAERKQKGRKKKKKTTPQNQKTQTHIVLAFLIRSVVADVAVYMKRGVWGSFLVGGRTAYLWGCRHTADLCEQTCYRSIGSCHFCGHFCLFTWYVIWGGEANRTPLLAKRNLQAKKCIQ